MSLKTKFLCTFLVIMLIPFIAFSLVIQHNSEESVKNFFASEALDSITQFCFTYDKHLYQMESLISQITSNRTIFDTFNELYDKNIEKDQMSLQHQKNLEYELKYITYTKVDKLMGIYYFNKRACFELYSLNPVNNLETALFSEAGSCLINVNLRTYADGKRRFVLSTSREIINARSHLSEGVLLVDYDYDRFLKSVFEQMKNSVYLGKDFYILDKENTIIYNSDTSKLLKRLEYTANNNASVINLKDSKFYTATYTSPYTGWKFISLMPVEQLNSTMKNSKLLLFLLTFILLIIALLFSFIISSRILKPINLLISFMHQVKSGNLSARIHIKCKDETKLLADSFNEMTSNLETMINKVYIAEIKQREAELLSLQSQINPHFLYNTLESIRGTAIESQNIEIALMTKCLANMLRYSINKNILSTISEEILHVQNYISIQNFRFDNKFELICNVPQDFQCYQLIRLTLQPFIENSIKHGFKNKLGRGVIQISFSKYNSDIKITIRDNGSGMSPTQIISLNEMLNSEIDKLNVESTTNEAGIGIINVNQRIKLFFGPKYGVKYLDSMEGTLVEILIALTDGGTV